MNFCDLKLILKCCVKRNDIILTDFSRKTEKKTVNLHWWKMQGEFQNVGDYISPVVVDYAKKYHGIDGQPRKTKHLYAIGSIIDGGYQNATVWGSGLLRGRKKYIWKNMRKLDIRAVRGPKTREMLIENGYTCPEIYGDPAILMPRIYKPEYIKQKNDHIVIHHYIYGNDDENAITPIVKDYRTFIDKIVQAKKIISSSLHGIILAEAYGVPAVLLDEGKLSLFKFEDYYHSTGRFDFPIAKTLEEAFEIEPAPLPDFSEMQEKLLEVFPKDLWD